MRLEPVYLVAPLPVPTTMLRRRAFLLAGASFVAGACVGGSSALVVQGLADKQESTAPLDEELAWLRELCSDMSPIDLLHEYRNPLYRRIAKTPSDPLLWHGVHRLVQRALAAPTTDGERAAAELLVVLRSNMPVGFALADYEADLIRRSRGR